MFVTPSLLMWAMKSSPACLAWPVMGGGTVQGWLFPALPFHSLQDWASSWTQSRASIKDLAARQVFKLYYKNIKLAEIFLCAFGRFLLLNFKDNFFLLPPSGEIRFYPLCHCPFPVCWSPAVRTCDWLPAQLHSGHAGLGSQPSLAPPSRTPPPLLATSAGSQISRSLCFITHPVLMMNLLR